MTGFNSLLDAHTTYYLPNGYGSVYYTTPFAVKSRVVNGVQKFYTEQPSYPYDLWVKVCGSDCPYTESMEGWEISQMDGGDVATFIKSFSRGGGTYYDNGVRANSFIAGSVFGQSSLILNNMPSANFSVTLINPATSASTTMSLPFGYGGASGFSRTKMINANAHSSTKRSHELFAERELLDALQTRAGELRKRGSESASDVRQVEAAISELTLNLERIRVDTLLAKETLRREGLKAVEQERMPYIPTPRERMEDVMRLSRALWSLKPNAKTIANNVVRAHEAPAKKRDASAATAATEVSVKPGDASKWTMYTSVPSSTPGYFEVLDAYYGSYRGTSVLRLASFDADSGYWTQSVANAVNRRKTNGLNDNLIIDVTNNGGGSVCLNYHTMSYLVNAWTKLSNVAGGDVVYSEYDIRRSDVLRLLQTNGAYLSSYPDAFNPTSGASLGMSYYNNPTSRTIGSGTSSYTQGFNWNPCGNVNLYFTKASYHFDKIIVMTDGRCGSSCAYFVTQLRENNKVRLLSYGGIYGEPLATSSFAGGNVLNWDFVTDTVSTLPASPYSSYIAFNLRANYSPGKYPGTPRQFERLEADWYLPLWDSFFRFYNADNYNTTARFALYESVLPLFDQMPAGLVRTGAASATQLSAVLAVAAAAVFAILL